VEGAVVRGCLALIRGASNEATRCSALLYSIKSARCRPLLSAERLVNRVFYRAFIYRRRASVPPHRISAPFFHMDPLSVTASIVAILQLSNKVLGYLNDIKDVPKDRAKCAVEASSLNSLLVSLRFRLEEGSSNESWYTAVRALGVENGPLDQFKQALEELQAKMTGGGRLKRAGDALVWKFSKEEVTSILARMERLKTLVEIALQMDHL